MKLKIRNKYITDDIYRIVEILKSESGTDLLSTIIEGRNDLKVTCPYHSSGKEKHPSCYIHRCDTDDTEPGTGYCFACKKVFSLVELVALCFGRENDLSFGEEWLLERCDTGFISEVKYLPEIVLDAPKDTEEFLDEKELDKYQYYHDYMWKRKLSKEVVDKFEVGFDPSTDRLIFPVRDDKGNLLCITSRSVRNKFFTLPEGKKKPVYLLYYIKKNNIQTVAVCESQINALVAWSYGFPAVALFGTGTSYQLELLKKSGVTDFVLMFDGDEAGRRGAMRFKEHMPKDRFITDIVMPSGKDVADCSYSEFWDLISSNINNYIV